MNNVDPLIGNIRVSNLDTDIRATLQAIEILIQSNVSQTVQTTSSLNLAFKTLWHGVQRCRKNSSHTRTGFAVSLILDHKNSDSWRLLNVMQQAKVRMMKLRIALERTFNCNTDTREPDFNSP